MNVGVVSDTHGLFDPKLARLFRGVALILHGGDVTGPDVLEELGRIAPVHTARGNNDVGAFGAALAEHVWVELGELTAMVVHRIGSRARLDPKVARALDRRPAEIVVHGHSHRPGVELVGGRLFVNPGSAGARRFALPRAAGLLSVRASDVEVRLFDLAPDDPAPLGAPFHARW